MRKIVISTVLAAIALVGLSFLPVTQKRVITRGIDSFETHQALFGNRTATQEITTSGKLLGAGAILVDMLRSGQPGDVHIKVRDASTREILTTATLPGNTLMDDEFSFTHFGDAVGTRNKKMTIEFSSPDATSKNPVGLRFDNAVADSKQFAVQVLEKVPLWQYLVTNITQNTDKWQMVLIAGAGALGISILSLRPGWRKQPVRIRRAIELGIILALAALAFNTRMAVLPDFKGVSGGDPYNYLFITDSLVNLQNPFAGVKRLPGYPLLLAPAYLSQSIDDQAAMRTISATAGAGSLIMIALLARALGLPWTIQLAAPAIIAWQKDFFWTSLRPEAYSVFTFLLLASLVLFFTARKPWQQLLFGLVLGYAAMTRQEGFVLAAILGAASLIQEIYISRTKKPYKFKTLSSKLARMYLPAFVIVLPFFLHNTLEYGNPFFTPYFEGERLQIVDSWEAFKDASGATWGVLDSMWKPAWEQLERYALTDRPFYVSAGLLIAWSLIPYSGKRFSTHERSRQTLWVVLLLVGVIGFSFLLWKAAAHKPAFAGYMPIIAAAVLLASSIPFVAYTRWQGTLVWLILVSQILIPTWFHPYPKHYQQSYPLIGLLIAAALLVPVAALTKKPTLLGKAARVSMTAALLVPFFVIPLYLFESKTFNTNIDQFNAEVALDTVVYQAVQAARDLPGPIGFDEAYLPALLYFNDQAQYFPAIEHPSPQQERSWIENNNIRTLVTTNNNNILSQPDPSWELVQQIFSEGKNERLLKSSIYTIQ